MTIEPWMNCRDISASIEFYTGVLDFEVAVAPHPDPENFDSRHAVLRREDDILHLDSHGRDKGPFGTQIYVRVTGIDAICSRFIANGLTLDIPSGGTAPIDQTWGMREIGFRDPDGNRLSYGEPITSST